LDQTTGKHIKNPVKTGAYSDLNHIRAIMIIEITGVERIKTIKGSKIS
jgi:hypothetical protein